MGWTTTRLGTDDLLTGITEREDKRNDRVYQYCGGEKKVHVNTLHSMASYLQHLPKVAFISGTKLSDFIISKYYEPKILMDQLHIGL